MSKESLEKRLVRATKTSEGLDAVSEEGNEWIGLLRISQSSVEITRDAKGSIKATVKAYADSSDEAAEAAVKTYNKLLQDLGMTE